MFIMEQKRHSLLHLLNDRRQTIAYQAFRFSITGITAVIIHYSLYLVLCKWMTTLHAYIIGYVVSFVCNFLLTCVFTFHKCANLYRGIGFCFAHIINFCLQIGLFKLFLYIGMQPAIAPLPVLGITVPINFLLVRYVFKK